MVITTRKMVRAIMSKYSQRSGTSWMGRKPTGSAGECVDNITTDETANDTNDGSNWDGSRRLTERNTSDEDYSFHALSQNGNEGQEEEDPFASKSSSVGF